jgi:hypothetical protein
MKNLLFALVISAATLLSAGCATHVMADKQPPVDRQPPVAGDASPAPAVPEPQISPDVNFKAYNTMPGEQSL